MSKTPLRPILCFTSSPFLIPPFLALSLFQLLLQLFCSHLLIWLSILLAPFHPATLTHSSLSSFSSSHFSYSTISQFNFHSNLLFFSTVPHVFPLSPLSFLAFLNLSFHCQLPLSSPVYHFLTSLDPSSHLLILFPSSSFFSNCLHFVFSLSLPCYFHTVTAH